MCDLWRKGGKKIHSQKAKNYVRKISYVYSMHCVFFVCLFWGFLLCKSSHTLWWQKASITDEKSSQLEVTGAAGTSENVLRNILMTFYFYFTLLKQVNDLIGNLII